MTSYQQLEISHWLGNHIATVYDIMVHYGRPEQPKPSPPQRCTKCGSHRTQVIGRLEDGKTLIVRCNACGAHSTVGGSAPGRLSHLDIDHFGLNATGGGERSAY